MSDIPKRTLGKTGRSVSILGLGGHHLGSAESYEEAERIVHEAIESGIDFFDNCWEYHNGKSELWMGRALKGRRDKVFLMTKVCTHGRNKDVAMQMLEESLRRLGTDHLDLWQAHGMVFESDPERAYASDGVLAAFDLAKQQGKVRHVGFTGHKNPDVHREMLTRGYPFDTVQMPLNPFDASFRSFAREVIPEAQRRGVAILGMKSLSGHGDPVLKQLATAEELLRYAMSLPVAVTISGIDSLAILRQNVSIARGFTPMSEAEMSGLRERCRTAAADGRFELYKVSLKFDNPEARTAHGFPNDPQSVEIKEKLHDVGPP
jgi:aryl-alcohol dehydrogenase-like predicted oxidoreductase